ncbi:hypothetical protein BDV93DRAFT_529528 [Ceratobasidium sp. AG-I]|nr:hypothetical protein BDV93DRAFT_529528 [Ceratobasidium sp. AG-I]
MSVLTLKDENLTDEDLRNMYDAEEVERYLRLFASRVSEVAIHPDRADSGATIRADDEDDWVSLSSGPAPPAAQRPTTLPPHLTNPSNPFEHIAAFIYPHIAQPPPPPSAPKRKFKLSKAAAAAERLYIATYPAYVPPLLYLCRLSSWRDARLSAFWCCTFWVAWAFGFLTPLIVGRVLLALVRGGTVTREEIRRKREATREAELLGKAIQGGVPGVGVGGNFGVWQLMKMVGKRGKKNGKRAKGVVEELRKEGEEVDGVSEVSVGDTVDPGTPVDGGEAADAEDWKLALIDVAEELADLHERVKNIFLHRRAATTRTYTILITLLFIATIFIQNTSKLITLTIGIFFWFIPPIVKLLPKLPPAFADAPTDAEVAMELIARRVARGERVVPERRRKRVTKPHSISPGAGGEGAGLGSPGSSLDLTKLTSPSTTSLLGGSATEDEDGDVGFVMPRDREEVKEGTEVYEEKFRKGAVKAWNWLGKAKGLMDEVRGVDGGRGTYASPEQSFPAQHRSRPGMLMISATHLTFNPLFAPASTPIPSSSSVPCHTTAASKNTIHVDIDDLRGVKKVSPGGLIVRYVRGGEVVEERFLLVVGRDEAFATLVGWGGGRWKHV